MSKFISGIFLVAFATAGIVSLLREFWLWLLKADYSGTYYMVIPISGHKDNAEAALRSAVERVKFINGDKIRILCVDCGMDEETGHICRDVCEENSRMSFCNIQELSDIIKMK